MKIKNKYLNTTFPQIFPSAIFKWKILEFVKEKKKINFLFLFLNKLFQYYYAIAS